MTDTQALEILGITDEDVVAIQKISNSPIFPEVERFVLVNLQLANSNSKTFEFYFTIGFIKDGVNVTNSMAQPTKNIIYTDSTIKQLIRDVDTFEPIPNPEWDGESQDEYDMYLWEYGWTMIKRWLKNDIVIEQAIKNYVAYNDLENFFDN